MQFSAEMQHSLYVAAPIAKRTSEKSERDGRQNLITIEIPGATLLQRRGREVTDRRKKTHGSEC